MPSPITTLSRPIRHATHSISRIQRDESGLATLAYSMGISFIVMPIAISSFWLSNATPERAQDGFLALLSNANLGLL